MAACRLEEFRMTVETFARPGRALALAILVLAGLVPVAGAVAQEPPPAPAEPAEPAGTVGAAGAAGRLTLEAALARALAANPTVARTRSQIASSQADIRRIRTSILPHVDVEANATKNSREVAFDFDGNRAVILPGNDWAYTFTVSQPIYAGTRELKALRQGRLAVEDARQQARAGDDQVLADTASDFLAVIEGDALVAVERGNLQLASRRKTQSQAFYDAGEVTRVDLLRADTDVKASERRLAAARQQRDEAVSRLRVDLALDTAEPLEVAAPSIPFPARPAASDLAELAVAERPEVRRAEAARDVAALEVAKQRLARLPVIRAEGKLQGQKGNFPADQYGSVALRFNMPIFDSGEISARVAVAEEQLKQAEVTLAETRRVVREQVLRSALALETAETNLALAKEQLAAAPAEYDQTFELYRAQEATSLDAQSAESSLAEARRAVVTGQLQRDLAELSLWFTAGTLKKSLNLDSPLDPQEGSR
jgi:outer membrane protein